MASISVIDQLDDAIGILLTDPEAPAPHADSGISEMIALAAELRTLPNMEFRAQLKSRLMDQIFAKQEGAIYPAVASPNIADDTISLPTLFAGGLDAAPIPRMRIAASFLMHAAAAALIATSGFWMVQHRQEIQDHTVSLITNVGEYVLPAAPDKTGGGGGGGDRDKLTASKGALPKFARDQITPPMIVVRNEAPKLVVPPSVVMPDIKLPQIGTTGDPMARVTGPLSNGTGSGGGIGSGDGGGVGSGRGPGVGPGWGGGIGGGVYRVGGGVSAPRATFAPDPEYSDEARKAKYQGTVILFAIITPEGRASDLRIVRSLGMGLDEKAMDAVRKWRFDPATKDGLPVAVQVNIEVNFHLY